MFCFSVSVVRISCLSVLTELNRMSFWFAPKLKHFNISFFLFSKPFSSILVRNAKTRPLPAGLISDRVGKSERQKKQINIIGISITALIGEFSVNVTFAANITEPIIIFLMINLRKKKEQTLKVVSLFPEN